MICHWCSYSKLPNSWPITLLGQALLRTTFSRQHFSSTSVTTTNLTSSSPPSLQCVSSSHISHSISSHPGVYTKLCVHGQGNAQGLGPDPGSTRLFPSLLTLAMYQLGLCHSDAPPSSHTSYINCASSPPATVYWVLPCRCSSRSEFSPCSSRATWCQYIHPLSIPQDTPAEATSSWHPMPVSLGQVDQDPPIHWQNPSSANPWGAGHPTDSVAAYHHLLTLLPTVSQNKPLLTYSQHNRLIIVIITMLSRALSVLLDAIGLDMGHYSLHSLRRGETLLCTGMVWINWT